MAQEKLLPDGRGFFIFMERKTRQKLLKSLLMQHQTAKKGGDCVSPAG